MSSAFSLQRTLRQMPLCAAYCDRCSSKTAASTLTDFLDRLGRKEQHDALIHLTLRWAERQKKDNLEDSE